ncbi:MAG TPA: hypothetical protein VF526_20915 [Solirubrobacteraceae bacterium]
MSAVFRRRRDEATRSRREPGIAPGASGNEDRRQAGRRIDLRVLLLSADGQEPAFHAWEAALDREGVPYHAIVARRGHPPIDAHALAVDATRAHYQAVIVAAGGLPAYDGARYVSALTAEEWTALAEFEREFGIRRITGFAYPSALYGLSAPMSSGATALSGTLTRAGKAVFGELRGDVPIDPNAYGYLATPVDESFTTLVAGPDNSALVGIYTHPDGRQEMVCTVDGNPAMIHVQLLRHGMLRWVTRGVYLGHQRHYLGLQVDDVFLSDDSWDRQAAGTVPVKIRMQREDVEAAVRWSRARAVRLDLGFNGHGAQQSDDLTSALLEHEADFGWINHTFGHVVLDEVDAETLRAEIRRNVDFAGAAGLTVDESELVTGEHSGLANTHLPGVLADTGVRWIATDSSRDRAQRTIATARTVPRHPTNMYFNVCTRTAQLDEYHHLYLSRMGCEGRAATRTRLAPATTWRSFLEREAQTMLDHILANDPRPHYLHQSNLTGDRMLFDLVDELLDRHCELFCVQLVQPTLAEAGAELARQAAWQEAQHSGRAMGFLEDGRLHLSSTERVQIPITGALLTEGDGVGEESGWTALIGGPEDDHVVFALA